MKFRPCIDIHNGKVKQIVGSSLRDEGDSASENYVATCSAAEFAARFKGDGLTGGHVILLNGKDSPYYEATAREARAALHAFPNGLQVGGGITAESAAAWIREGASHVIVTSYVFRDGRIDYEHLHSLVDAVGKEHIVLDLSCRKRAGGDAPGDDPYYICTDRWQKFTDTAVTCGVFADLSGCCDEFLVHGIAVEGKGGGIDEPLVLLLSEAAKAACCPITYAGGIRSLADIEKIRLLGDGVIDYTVGSALDLYGGHLPYSSLIPYSPITSDIS